jgi:hypothetical protein
MVCHLVHVAGFSSVSHCVESVMGTGHDAGMSMRLRVCVDPVWVRKNLIDCHALFVASPILIFLSRFR